MLIIRFINWFFKSFFMEFIDELMKTWVVTKHIRLPHDIINLYDEYHKFIRDLENDKYLSKKERKSNIPKRFNQLSSLQKSFKNFIESDNSDLDRLLLFLDPVFDKVNNELNNLYPQLTPRIIMYAIGKNNDALNEREKYGFIAQLYDDYQKLKLMSDERYTSKVLTQLNELYNSRLFKKLKRA